MMQYRLSTLFLLFVVLWTSLAVFGVWGGTAAFVILIAATTCLSHRGCLMALFAVFPLAALLLPAMNAAHDSFYQAHCIHCLFDISMALDTYHQANGCYPPAYIADKDGKPMHSWRVLILPYLLGRGSHLQYRFDEPWNGPNNKKLLPQRPYDYACPDDEKNFRTPGASCTNYVAVVGADAAWQGKTPRKFADFHGRPWETIMVVEVAGAEIPWTEPRDVCLDAPRGAANSIAMISSKHLSHDWYFFYSPRPTVNCAVAPMGVRCLPSGLPQSEKFRDILKTGGLREEYLTASWPISWRIHWSNCCAFAVWVASSGWLLLRAVRSRKRAGELAAATAGGTEAPDDTDKNGSGQ